MGLWDKVKKTAKKATKSAGAALDPVQDKLKAEVKKATKGTAVERVADDLSAIDFDDNPLGGVVKAHTDAGKFLFSEEAAGVGLAAMSGNPAAAAKAAGGKKGEMFLAGVQAYDEGGMTGAASAFGLPSDASSLAANVAKGVGPKLSGIKASASVSLSLGEAAKEAPGVGVKVKIDRDAWRREFAARPETVGGVIGERK